MSAGDSQKIACPSVFANSSHVNPLFTSVTTPKPSSSTAAGQSLLPPSADTELKPVVKTELVRKILESSPNNRSSAKLSNDAASLSRDLVHRFVVEALDRSKAQLFREGDSGPVTEAQLAKGQPKCCPNSCSTFESLSPSRR